CRQVFGEVLAREAQRLADAIGFAVQLREGGELRLSAGPAMINNQIPRDLSGCGDAEVTLDHGECQIDPGGDPGGRPDGAVDHEDAVARDVQRRIVALQPRDELPMRYRPSPGEQAQFRELERTGADA